MGNCQASDAVVIQHPGGREERLYWPTSAASVMKRNPGYHVALVTLCLPEEKQDGGAAVRVTRVRLLKPKDMLLLGQVYRLIASQGDDAGEDSAQEQHAAGSEEPALASFAPEHLRIGNLALTERTQFQMQGMG